MPYFYAGWPEKGNIGIICSEWKFPQFFFSPSFSWKRVAPPPWVAEKIRRYMYKGKLETLVQHWNYVLQNLWGRNAKHSWLLCNPFLTFMKDSQATYVYNIWLVYHNHWYCGREKGLSQNASSPAIQHICTCKLVKKNKPTNTINLIKKPCQPYPIHLHPQWTLKTLWWKWGWVGCLLSFRNSWVFCGSTDG